MFGERRKMYGRADHIPPVARTKRPCSIQQLLYRLRPGLRGKGNREGTKVRTVVSWPLPPRERRFAARRNEKGFSLVEVVVAVAIIGLIGLGFSAAFGTGFKVLAQTDELETAKNLAETQMEYVRSLPYDSSGTYAAGPIPGEYPNYSAAVTSAPITSRDINIQKITVNISHGGEQVLALEGYKVHR